MSARNWGPWYSWQNRRQMLCRGRTGTAQEDDGDTHTHRERGRRGPHHTRLPRQMQQQLSFTPEQPHASGPWVTPARAWAPGQLGSSRRPLKLQEMPLAQPVNLVSVYINRIHTHTHTHTHTYMPGVYIYIYSHIHFHPNWPTSARLRAASSSSVRKDGGLGVIKHHHHAQSSSSRKPPNLAGTLSQQERLLACPIRL